MVAEDIVSVSRELMVDRSNWRKVKFGDVAIQQKENVDRENTDLTRYVAGEHMGSEDLHIRQWGEISDDYLGPAFHRKFETGDILYGSRRTYLRKVAVAHFDGITANTTFVIKANEKLIIRDLLPFVLLSEGFAQHSIKNSKGSVNPYINWKDIADYEFLLPPKDQQAQIAELLWAGDEMIESENSLLASLKSKKKAFLDYIFNKADCREFRLEEITVNLDNKRKPVKESLRLKGNVPYYGASGIVDYVEGFTFNEPILLISEDGENLSSRKLPIAYEVDGESWVNNHAHVVKLLNESRYLVCEYLNHTDLVDYISGGTRPKITKGDLNKIKILLPQPELCAQKEKQLKSIDFSKTSVERRMMASKTLQKSLINQFF